MIAVTPSLLFVGAGLAQKQCGKPNPEASRLTWPRSFRVAFPSVRPTYSAINKDWEKWCTLIPH